jgi:hypothetical protein
MVGTMLELSSGGGKPLDGLVLAGRFLLWWTLVSMLTAAVWTLVARYTRRHTRR